MRRREFLPLVTSAAASWPRVVLAQQPAMPVIGLLQIGPASSWDLTGFRRGLKETGYVEGQNLAIEYRWANDNPDDLPKLAADLVHRQVRVIATIGSSNSALAAKAATDSIPVVFGHGGDPVQQGLVASLNRPGGNVTGVTSQSGAIFGKQLGILHELLPQAVDFGVLSNPRNPLHDLVVKETQAAASIIGVTVEVLTASTSGEIDAVFARTSNEGRVQGLLVSNDVLFMAGRVQVAILAARSAIPAIYPFREQAEAGGLLSYGPDLSDRDREVGHYVGRILKGERPAVLPVQQESKFETVINMKTAKALGVSVPQSLLARADEVIE
jgi:putative ABC transport system substrate-binding protein